jgi:general stress protein YciG
MTDNQLTSQTKSHRGFAAMDPARQRELARRGGRAAHERGTAHEFSPEEARRAGQRGGAVVCRDRQHMATIGSRGGRNRGNGTAAHAANQAATGAGGQSSGATTGGTEGGAASAQQPPAQADAQLRSPAMDKPAPGEHGQDSQDADTASGHQPAMRRTPRSRQAHGVDEKNTDQPAAEPANEDEQGS